MKEILQQVETYLTSLIEGNILEIFGTADAEKKLVHQFITEMEAGSFQDESGNTIAPNYYSLNVRPDFFAEIRSNQLLLDKLARHIYDAGNQAGLQFMGKVNIAVFPDRALETGAFSVKAIVRDLNLSETTPSFNTQSPAATITTTPRAFFIVGGTKIFTIEENIITIGRQLDNDLVINQPRISRKHAQVRLIKGRHMIFDLDSSGGTFVNNKRVQQVVLHPGDVVSLAGVPLVYGHDTSSSYADTEEYLPPTSKDTLSSANTMANPIDEDDTDSQAT
ncbi:MAG: FhaA domain-containing protein, partial [Anaerolineales bacterium]